MTDEAPIVPLSTKLRSADETLRMVIESVFAKRGIPATDVFFTLLKHYGIASWSRATDEEKQTVDAALQKTMRYLEVQNIEWTNLSSEEKERWMKKAIEIL